MVRGGVTLNLFLRTTRLNYKARPDCKLEQGRSLDRNQEGDSHPLDTDSSASH